MRQIKALLSLLAKSFQGEMPLPDAESKLIIKPLGEIEHRAVVG